MFDPPPLTNTAKFARASSSRALEDAAAEALIRARSCPRGGSVAPPRARRAPPRELARGRAGATRRALAVDMTSSAPNARRARLCRARVATRATLAPRERVRTRD